MFWDLLEHGCSLKEAVSMPTQGMPSFDFTRLSVWQNQGEEVSKRLAGVRSSSKMTQPQQTASQQKEMVNWLNNQPVFHLGITHDWPLISLIRKFAVSDYCWNCAGNCVQFLAHTLQKYSYDVSPLLESPWIRECKIIKKCYICFHMWHVMSVLKYWFFFTLNVADLPKVSCFHFL